MMIARLTQFATGITTLLMLQVTPVLAADSCEVTVGRLATLEGQVEIQQTGMASWQPGKLNDALCQGDTVRAGKRSRATVVLVNQAVLRIDQNTAMRLDNITGVTGERSALSLFKGALQSFSRKPRGFEISTPYLNGSIEGTEFVFRVEDGESLLTVFEGTVVASNDQGSASVSGGESVAATAGQAPQLRTVVQPRDAAQWSLYYPPILAAGGSDTSISPALRQAASDLSVGRVEQARSSVDQAIADDAGAGLAYALRAVIEVVQNQREQALTDASKAVSLSPDSTAAKIALSYAQQANFQISEARDTLQQAVAQQPNDALARARLAELQLMLGDREQATASAQQAVALAPDLGRTQITLGFAALAEFRNDEATAAFEKAIALDSADPLPHLGLGLAKISAGDLEAGRSDIEVAVGLGSNDALLRAYLGKAYFEEKRASLDSQQFTIAKLLDPNDPTAFLYDGIAKQTQNRPVEAVQDLEKSIELNDNRAAYRGRLLLDKDRAARGTSLARAYNDLGFAQLGVNESTESMTVDPSNASAHRFLSDTYRGQRRREISRVSELLQAQLMQDVNINPVQPSISATNLNIVTLGGPASAGFNEFTPLFERNKTQFDASGFGGNNDTYGGEAAVTALYDQFSLSFGAFSYDSDGWRPNNDVDQELYNAFAQWAVSPELNLQIEYSSQDTDQGDLAFRFDPDDFLDNRRLDINLDNTRLGARYSPDPASNFLISYIDSNRTEKESFSEQFDPVTNFLSATDLEQDSSIYEAQYLYQAERFNIVTGAHYSDSTADKDDRTLITIEGVGPVVDETISTDVDSEHSRAYVYSNNNLSDRVMWTVGASYDDFKDKPIEDTSFNPKLGVRWDVQETTQLRAAAFKVLKPQLINNRTIEPTQVAGFNQFFDDSNGTESWRYGIALDSRLATNLSWGVEATWRELDVPVPVSTEDTITDDVSEQLHRLYLNWTPVDRIALEASIVYDYFENDNEDIDPVPAEVETYSLPLGATYFHPDGWFAGILGTYVDQDVKRAQDSVHTQGNDSFFVTEVSVGYRFPKRMGIVSLGVKNLFDEEFSYLDDSYREFSEDATTGPYYPERIIMGRVTLNF